VVGCRVGFPRESTALKRTYGAFGPGDEDVRTLDEGERGSGCWRTGDVFWPRFQGDEPIGSFWLKACPEGMAPSMLSYELLEVEEHTAATGIATRMLDRARADRPRLRGIGEAFVLTEPDTRRGERPLESLGGGAEEATR